MIAGIILFVVAVLFRLLPVFLGFTETQPDWLINFSPMAAMILCGAAVLPKRIAVLVPFGALLLTDLVLTLHYNYEVFNAYFVAKTFAFVAIAAFGWQLRSHVTGSVLLPAAIAGSLFFYLVTNTAAWLYHPAYAKDMAGWTQAMTTGLPGFQPTWSFYRNTFLSDIVFTMLFLVCIRPSTRAVRAEKAPAAAW